MGLITGLVSTVVHVAAGRNPYSSNNHNQDGGSQSVVTTAGYADPSSRSAGYGCAHGTNGQPCGICAVALPFGKGRQLKRERRELRHEMRHGGGRGGMGMGRGLRFPPGRFGMPAAGGPEYQEYYPQQQYGQQGMSRAVPSGRQEEGVAQAVVGPAELPAESSRTAHTGADMPAELPCEGRMRAPAPAESSRRASTGAAELPAELPCESRRRASADEDMAPPAYEEVASSRVAVRRSVEVLENEKRELS